MLLVTNKMQKNYVKRINKNVILLHVVGYGYHCTSDARSHKRQTTGHSYSNWTILRMWVFTIQCVFYTAQPWSDFNALCMNPTWRKGHPKLSPDALLQDTYCVTLWIFIGRETISRTAQEENASHAMCVPVCLYQILGKQTKEETRCGWSTSRDFQRSRHRDSSLSRTLSYTVWCWSWLPHLAPLYYANNLTAFQKRKKTRKNKQICLEEKHVKCNKNDSSGMMKTKIK